MHASQRAALTLINICNASDAERATMIERASTSPAHAEAIRLRLHAIAEATFETYPRAIAPGIVMVDGLTVDEDDCAPCPVCGERMLFWQVRNHRHDAHNG